MRRMTFNAAELDKFVILSGEFSFQDEILEEASKHEPWSKIVNAINNGSAYKPILIFDIIDVTLYFGIQENDALYLQSLYTNQGYILEIQYDITTDKLTITKTVENYLSEDNVKTLFGNQSIIGTGNIDLYRHYLTITDINGKVAKFEWISSSNINVSGVGTKLKDLLKCSGIESSRKYGHGYEDSDLTTPCIMYWLGSSMGILSLKFGSSSPSEISNVVDIVETI